VPSGDRPSQHQLRARLPTSIRARGVHLPDRLPSYALPLQKEIRPMTRSQPIDARIEERFAEQQARLAAMSFPHALAVGDRAADFELPNAQGRRIRLADQLERGPVVLHLLPWRLVSLLQPAAARSPTGPTRNRGGWSLAARNLAPTAGRLARHHRQERPHLRGTQRPQQCCRVGVRHHFHAPTDRPSAFPRSRQRPAKRTATADGCFQLRRPS